MIDTAMQFQAAIRATGLEPPAVIEPGRIHRFPGQDKRPGNTAGWCMMFDDGQGGCFGDWSTGLAECWQTGRVRPLSKGDRAAFMRKIMAAKAEADREREACHEEAAERAAHIWNRAEPAPIDHPYLSRKAISANGARLHKGMLVLPMIDFVRNLCSLQFIDGDGFKRFLVGGRKQGCYIPVARTEERPSRVIICEGWATGCTLAEWEPDATVLAAIDAGNLEAVAVEARCQWPKGELVIAGDDDRQTPGNPGRTKATAAAIAADAKLAFPQWPADAPHTLTDFNDLAAWLKEWNR